MFAFQASLLESRIWGTFPISEVCIITKKLSNEETSASVSLASDGLSNTEHRSMIKQTPKSSSNLSLLPLSAWMLYTSMSLQIAKLVTLEGTVHIFKEFDAIPHFDLTNYRFKYGVNLYLKIFSPKS